jgi:hypothetical protein
MHIYVVISSIYIGHLIYYYCTKKPNSEWEDYIDETLTNFPLIHYINKINNLAFFSEDENFTRLCKIFDNPDIYEKMINIIENDKHINEEYLNMKDFFTERYFDYNHPINIPIEINDRIFNTNLPRLYFIKWFIQNDYFLFVE